MLKGAAGSQQKCLWEEHICRAHGAHHSAHSHPRATGVLPEVALGCLRAVLARLSAEDQEIGLFWVTELGKCPREMQREQLQAACQTESVITVLFLPPIGDGGGCCTGGSKREKLSVFQLFRKISMTELTPGLPSLRGFFFFGC